MRLLKRELFNCGLWYENRQLHRDPSVLFAGYKLPHPLQYRVVVKVRLVFSTALFSYLMHVGVRGLKKLIPYIHLLRFLVKLRNFALFHRGFLGREWFLLWLSQIQTNSQSSPMQAYNLAITDLTKELDHLKATFEVNLMQILKVLVFVTEISLVISKNIHLYGSTLWVMFITHAWRCWSVVQLKTNVLYFKFAARDKSETGRVLLDCPENLTGWAKLVVILGYISSLFSFLPFYLF